MANQRDHISKRNCTKVNTSTKKSNKVKAGNSSRSDSNEKSLKRNKE